MSTGSSRRRKPDPAVQEKTGPSSSTTTGQDTGAGNQLEPLHPPRLSQARGEPEEGGGRWMPSPEPINYSREQLHLPYFLSAWKLHCFPSCKGSSVPKNFSKAMTSFQDRTVYGGGEPGLIIGTGKGERGIWKSSTFPATRSGAAQPQPSPDRSTPKGCKTQARRGNPRDPVLLDFTILILWKGEER